MHRFWDSFIHPFLEAVTPDDIVEVGAERGFHTEKLLSFCQAHGARLHVVDPVADYEAKAFQENYPESFVQYVALSLDALPEIPSIDVALLDGDHNWYTVYNELKLIDAKRKAQDKPFPFVFFHDVGWPYARRDLYYAPETIPKEFRHPYKQAGILPGHNELANKNGYNRCMNNALNENTPRNGVLTAVEDFIEESDEPLALFSLPVLMGLGFLYDPKQLQRYPKAVALLNQIEAAPNLYSLLEKVEEERFNLLLGFEELFFDRQFMLDKMEKFEDILKKFKSVIAESEDARHALEEKLEQEQQSLEAMRRERDALTAQLEEFRP